MLGEVCPVSGGCGSWPTPLPLALKQVTTLPWHFTPKGALFGPIYGIYVG